MVSGPRERESERKKREPRSRFRRRRRTLSSSPTIARTRSHRSRRSQHHVARSRLRAISPSTQSLRPTDLRPTDLSLSLWFWFLLLLWWCGSGVLVVVAFDCRSLLLWVELEFRWCVVLGFGCDFKIFCNKICWDVEKIAEKIWKICRKIVFSE